MHNHQHQPIKTRFERRTSNHFNGNGVFRQERGFNSSLLKKFILSAKQRARDNLPQEICIHDMLTSSGLIINTSNPHIPYIEESILHGGREVIFIVERIPGGYIPIASYKKTADIQKEIPPYLTARAMRYTLDVE